MAPRRKSNIPSNTPPSQDEPPSTLLNREDSSMNDDSWIDDEKVDEDDEEDEGDSDYEDGTSFSDNDSLMGELSDNALTVNSTELTAVSNEASQDIVIAETDSSVGGKALYCCIDKGHNEILRLLIAAFRDGSESGGHMTRSMTLKQQKMADLATNLKQRYGSDMYSETLESKENLAQAIVGTNTRANDTFRGTSGPVYVIRCGDGISDQSSFSISTQDHFSSLQFDDTMSMMGFLSQILLQALLSGKVGTTYANQAEFTHSLMSRYGMQDGRRGAPITGRIKEITEHEYGMNVLSYSTGAYHEVYVLMVEWEACDLPIEEERNTMKTLFEQVFHWMVECVTIKSRSSEQSLKAAVESFLRRNAKPENLIIIYYDGHACMEDKGLYLAEQAHYKSSVVQWGTVQEMIFENSQADVFVALMTCNAGGAIKDERWSTSWDSFRTTCENIVTYTPKQHPSLKREFIGACGEEEVTGCEQTSSSYRSARWLFAKSNCFPPFRVRYLEDLLRRDSLCGSNPIYASYRLGESIILEPHYRNMRLFVRQLLSPIVEPATEQLIHIVIVKRKTYEIRQLHKQDLHMMSDVEKHTTIGAILAHYQKLYKISTDSRFAYYQSVLRDDVQIGCLDDFNDNIIILRSVDPL